MSFRPFKLQPLIATETVLVKLSKETLTTSKTTLWLYILKDNKRQRDMLTAALIAEEAPKATDILVAAETLIVISMKTY